MARIHHAIDNIEFGVTDLAATQAFYESAFGWRFNNYGPEYAGIVVPGGNGEAGGLDANRRPETGGPLVQIYSVDLDATAAAVTAARGQIVEGPYDFPGSRGFRFTDPSGNQLGVWTPA
jgi:hypothetical protein